MQAYTLLPICAFHICTPLPLHANRNTAPSRLGRWPPISVEVFLMWSRTSTTYPDLANVAETAAEMSFSLPSCSRGGVDALNCSHYGGMHGIRGTSNQASRVRGQRRFSIVGRPDEHEPAVPLSRLEDCKTSSASARAAPPNGLG